MKPVFAFTGAFLAAASVSLADIHDLQADWSDTANPNGPWTLRQGNTPLPHVNDWHLAGWTTPQPGWARSENAGIGLPFFFKSVVTDADGHDWATGQIVVHSTDSVNGSGSGPANIRFVVPEPGSLTIHGGVWIGREIGRSVSWTLFLNGTALTSGSVSSGDPYSSGNPLAFSAGSGGSAAVTDVHVSVNDSLVLRFNSDNPNAGDFVGIDLRVEINPLCPADVGTQGGTPGSDGQLDNNDFIVFISFFFAGDSRADRGMQGGILGSDGLFDNNDFIVFINQFFTGCG
jgi:hypothetical protein